MHACVCAQEDGFLGIPIQENIQREINWYNSRKLNVEDIDRTTKIGERIGCKVGMTRKDEKKGKS